MSHLVPPNAFGSNSAALPSGQRRSRFVSSVGRGSGTGGGGSGSRYSKKSASNPSISGGVVERTPIVVLDDQGRDVTPRSLLPRPTAEAQAGMSTSTANAQTSVAKFFGSHYLSSSTAAIDSIGEAMRASTTIQSGVGSAGGAADLFSSAVGFGQSVFAASQYGGSQHSGLGEGGLTDATTLARSSTLHRSRYKAEDEQQPFSLGGVSSGVGLADGGRGTSGGIGGVLTTHDDESDNVYETLVLTNSELDQMHDIVLSETSTMVLFDQPSVCVEEGSKEHERAVARLQEYARQKQQRDPDRFVSRAAQTFNEPVKHKEVQMTAVARRDAAVGTTTSDIHDAMETQRKTVGTGQSSFSLVDRRAETLRVSQMDEARAQAKEDLEARQTELKKKALAAQLMVFSEEEQRKREDVERTRFRLEEMERTTNVVEGLRAIERILVQEEYHDKVVLYRDGRRDSESKLQETLEPVGDEPSSKAEVEEAEVLWRFYDEEVTGGRRVSAIEFHRERTELVAIGYGQREDGRADESGLVCCWSVTNPAGPERVCATRSAVSAIGMMRKGTLVACGLVDGTVVVLDVGGTKGVVVVVDTGRTGEVEGGDAVRHTESVWGVEWRDDQSWKGENSGRHKHHHHVHSESNLTEGAAATGSSAVLVSVGGDGRVIEWTVRGPGVVESRLVMQLPRVDEGESERQKAVGRAKREEEEERARNEGKLRRKKKKKGKMSAGDQDESGDAMSTERMLSGAIAGLCVIFDVDEQSLSGNNAQQQQQQHHHHHHHHQQQLQQQQQQSYLYRVGTADGFVHLCSSAYTERSLSVFRAHSASVTGISVNPFASHLYATSSVDWTVHVWESSATGAVNLNSTDSASDTHSTPSTRPLLSVESRIHSPVRSVHWAPFSATVLALLYDNAVELWDISQSSLEPMATVQPSGPPPAMFSSLAFSPSSTTPILLVGDCVGRVSVYLLSRLRVSLGLGSRDIEKALH